VKLWAVWWRRIPKRCTLYNIIIIGSQLYLLYQNVMIILINTHIFEQFSCTVACVWFLLMLLSLIYVVVLVIRLPTPSPDMVSGLMC
jgi:hypothetical protein